VRRPVGQVEDALAALGCQADVLSLDPNTLDDVLDGIVQVGERTARASGPSRSSRGCGHA